MKNLNTLILSLCAITLLSCGGDDDTTVITPPLNNAPVLNDTTLSILENPTSDLITTLIATDADGDPLTYSIVSQTPANSITINDTNGEIIMNTPSEFDFEKNNEITATVKVSDGITDTTAQLTISLTDVLGPTNGLLAYYSFDNNNPDDMSGNNHNGTLNNSISPIANRLGKANGAFDLTGGGYVSIAPFGEVSDHEFSISVWVYKANSNTAFDAIVCKVGSNRDYALRLQPDNKINAHYSNSGLHFTQSDNPISLNQWHHIVLNVNQGTWSIYLDGTMVKQTTNGVSNIWDSINKISIGSLTASGSEYFDGNIDDVLFYDRELTAQEITDIYNNQY